MITRNYKPKTGSGKRAALKVILILTAVTMSLVGWPIPAAQADAPPHEDTLRTKAFLEPMAHEYQKLNNCGPASLAAAASLHGVDITQFEAADVVKGGLRTGTSLLMRWWTTYPRWG